MTTMIFILSFNLAISVSLVLTPACVGIVLPTLKLYSHEPENKPRNPFTFRALKSSSASLLLGARHVCSERVQHDRVLCLGFWG